MNTLLEIRGLEKNFGDRILFRIDRLIIEKARAYLLTGPNGAGKSTLLRILAGLEPATFSSLRYDNRKVSLYPRSRELRHRIVYVHQHPVMFDYSVARNVGYGLQEYGLPPTEASARVEEAIAWAGIGHLLKLPAASLSGGEKQRVALARARVLRPALLLLDEPTSSLDGAAREQVQQMIPQLLNDGCSLFIASHEHGLMNFTGASKMHLADNRLAPQFTCAYQAA